MEFLAIPSLIIVLTLWIFHSIFLNRSLLQNQKRYRQFFNDSPVALIVIDSNHCIIEWNERAQEIYGWESDEAIGENIIEFIVPDFTKTHVYSILKEAAIKGVSYSKNHNITKNRNEIFCEWSNRLIEGEEGEILCMAQDITLSQRTLDDLTKRSSALESAGDAIFYTDNKGLIEFANRSFFLLNLNDPDKIYGSHIGTYIFGERLAFSALQAHFDTKKMWRGTITKPSKTGNKVLSITITAIYNHARFVSYIANLHDITTLSSHVDELTYRAQYDQLTGAANRSAMNERLAHAMSRSNRNGQKIALYFIDLNDFKRINDHYGHEAGDILLRNVAINLKKSLRTTDTICRYGGDEFIVIIEDIEGEDHLNAIRQTIQTAIAVPIFIESDIMIQAHASIGMALYPTDATDAVGLIKMADIAMYTVKKEKALPYRD